MINKLPPYYMKYYFRKAKESDKPKPIMTETEFLTKQKWYNEIEPMSITKNISYDNYKIRAQREIDEWSDDILMMDSVPIDRKEEKEIMERIEKRDGFVRWYNGEEITFTRS